MSVYKDTKKGTWYVKFRSKSWTGAWNWVVKRGFHTKREAVAWETEYKAVRSGDLQMNLESFTQVYLGDVTARNKESTLTNKKSIINKWIVPYLGSRKMCDISEEDILHWQNMLLSHKDEKTGQSFSDNYLRNVNSTLHKILAHAQKYYKMKNNPMARVEGIGSTKSGDIDFWTLDEFNAFLEETREEPLAYYCFKTLYWTGVRKGELMALNVEDVDLENKIIHINKTYHHYKGRDIITPPKTENSNRIIDLPDELCEDLQDYIRMSYSMNPTDRLFPIREDFLSSRMKKYAERAGVKAIRIHDIRHSHVSLLMDMGTSAMAIGERVGHSSAGITYRYAHLYPEKKKEVMDKLNQAMEGEGKDVE